MTGLPTIIPLSRHDVFLGQRWNLSRSDIARVNKLYRCSQVAAQPETSTWRAFKKKMMDFIPGQTQPFANESHVETSTAWSPSTKASGGVAVSSSRTVDEGVTSLEAQTQTGWPWGAEDPKESMESSETSNKAEEGRGSLGPTAATPLKNLSHEMEVANVVSTAQKILLQNPTSSTKEPGRSSPSDKDLYLPEGQSMTMEGEFPSSVWTKSQLPISTEMVLDDTAKPGLKEQFGAQGKPTEDLSEAMEATSTTPTQSVGLGHAKGSPSPAEIDGFSVVRDQPKDASYQTISTFGNERSAPPQMGSAKTKAATASYRLLSASNIMGFGEEATMSPEAGSPESSDTLPGNVGKEVEGHQSKEHSTTMNVLFNASEKGYGENNLGLGAFPSQEALLPGSVRAPNAHLGWTGTESPSGSWFAVTKQPKDRTDSNNKPREREPFSYPSTHQRRMEKTKWEMLSRNTPPESFTGIGFAEHTPSQFNVREMGSLAIETHGATSPAERADLSGTVELRTRTLWLQSGPTKRYGSSALAMEQAPSRVVQKEWESDSASVTSTERLTMGQTVGLSHGGKLGTGFPGEAKTQGRATLWRLLSREPFSRQMPTQPGKQLAGTQRQPLSVESAIRGEGKAQVQTRNPNTVALKLLCGSKVFDTLSATKPSRRGASPDLGHKLGVSGGENPVLETKGHSSTLEGRSPSMGRISTPHSWVSKSNIDGNGTGNYIDLGKEETSSTWLHKATLEKTMTPGYGAPPTTNVSVPHVSSILVLSKRPQSSSVSWGTATDTPQSLEAATKSQVASHPHETISAEPVNATEEIVLHRMNWVATFAQDARNGQSGAWSPTLGVTSTALPPVSFAGETQLLGTSVEPPKPKNFGVTSIGSHPTKKSLTSAGKALALATAMVFVTYLPNATHLETWKSPTMGTIVGVKRWGEMATEEADASRATSTPSYMMTYAEASRQGPHEEHIAMDTSPQLHQSGMARQSTSGETATEEANDSRVTSTASYMMSFAEASRQGPHEEHIAVDTTPHLHQGGMALWSTSGPKSTEGLWEEKGKDCIQKSGVYEDTTIEGASNTGNRSPSPLTYPSSARDEEEHSTIHGETRPMPSSSGTYSRHGASMSSHPIHVKTAAMGSHPGSRTPRKPKVKATFPKKRVFRKLVVAPMSIPPRAFAPKWFKARLGAQKDGVFPIENLMEETQKYQP